MHTCTHQSYSGLRGAVAFALALSRIFEEEALQNPDDPDLENELTLRRTMLTSVTFLLLFTVFIQVHSDACRLRVWAQLTRYIITPLSFICVIVCGGEDVTE